jgi:hypothetical protein
MSATSSALTMEMEMELLRAGGPAGHMDAYCNVKGCRPVWYRPRQEPGCSGAADGG